MTELYEAIKLCQEGDEVSILKVLDKFERCILSNLKFIDTYKFMNSYDLEDNRHELIVTILTAIKSMPIQKDCFENDGCIVNYINKAIKNKRINFSKKISKKYSLEYQYGFDFDLLNNNLTYKGIDSDIIIKDLLNSLNTKEKNVMEYKFINGKSDIEIGNILNISRQSVNKTKNKALKKLKEIIS